MIYKILKFDTWPFIYTDFKLENHRTSGKLFSSTDVIHSFKNICDTNVIVVWIVG